MKSPSWRFWPQRPSDTNCSSLSSPLTYPVRSRSLPTQQIQAVPFYVESYVWAVKFSITRQILNHRPQGEHILFHISWFIQFCLRHQQKKNNNKTKQNLEKQKEVHKETKWKFGQRRTSEINLISVNNYFWKKKFHCDSNLNPTRLLSSVETV